jgi:molybdopterin converting factor small subunit
MLIQVKTFATLKKFEPEGAMLKVEPGATLRDVLAALSLPEDEVRLLFVNGVHSTLETVISEGDKVSLFPAVGGG